MGSRVAVIYWTPNVCDPQIHHKLSQLRVKYGLSEIDPDNQMYNVHREDMSYYAVCQTGWSLFTNEHKYKAWLYDARILIENFNYDNFREPIESTDLGGGFCRLARISTVKNNLNIEVRTNFVYYPC